jgi:hypothetical protein
VTAIDKTFTERRRPTYYSGLGCFLAELSGHDKDYIPSLTVDEQKAAKQMEKLEKLNDKQERMAKEWDTSIHGSEPFKTLFVYNLVSYIYNYSLMM